MILFPFFILACAAAGNFDGDEARQSASYPHVVEKQYQHNTIHLLFHPLSKSFLYNQPPIPMAYYVPRKNIQITVTSDGKVKILRSDPMDVSLNIAKYKDPNLNETALDQDKSWHRIPVGFPYIIPSFESTRFLGQYFHVITSYTDFPEENKRRLLSRFYYAPVFYGKYEKYSSSPFNFYESGFGVFSVCTEHSDDPEDKKIPVTHRPQRIVDAGVISPHIFDEDAYFSVLLNASNEYHGAWNNFREMPWCQLMENKEIFSKRPEKSYSGFWEMVREKPAKPRECLEKVDKEKTRVYHRYDEKNMTYVICYETSFVTEKGRIINLGDVVMFLDPGFHFESEKMLWDIYASLWKKEMVARYGTADNSKMVHPRSYFLAEDRNIVELYDGMVGRYFLPSSRGVKRTKSKSPSTRCRRGGLSSEKYQV